MKNGHSEGSGHTQAQFGFIVCNVNLKKNLSTWRDFYPKRFSREIKLVLFFKRLVGFQI